MKKIILIALTPVALLALTGCAQTSQGSHNGYITAVEKSGLIWKTGNAYIKTDLSTTQEDLYCVEDEDVYNKLVELKDNGTKVKVYFTDEFIIAPWRCGNHTTEGDSSVYEQGII